MSTPRRLTDLPPTFVPWEGGRLPPELWPPPPEDEGPEPLDLWKVVGGRRPWGTALLLLAWCSLFSLLALRQELTTAGYVRWGASLTWTSGPGELYRLLAHTFLHASVAHLFFNGLAMAVLGPAVERVFGRAQFWAVFALGGAGSALASVLWRQAAHPGTAAASVGASGAIFALGGAMLAAAWRLRRVLPISRARALAGGLLPLLLQGLVAGFQRAATDNLAHASGLVLGVALGAALPLERALRGRGTTPFTRILGAASELALLAALVLALWNGLRASAGSG